jgi:hypothetical protein
MKLFPASSEGTSPAKRTIAATTPFLPGDSKLLKQAASRIAASNLRTGANDAQAVLLDRINCGRPYGSIHLVSHRAHVDAGKSRFVNQPNGTDGELHGSPSG